MKTKKTTDRKSRIKQGKEFPISMRVDRVEESIHQLYPNQNNSKMKTFGGDETQKQQEHTRAISSALDAGRSIDYVIHEMYGHSSRVRKESLHPLFIDWTNLVLSIAHSKGIITEEEVTLFSVNENTTRDFAFPHLNKNRTLSQATVSETL